jgi:hypothetical protein
LLAAAPALGLTLTVSVPVDGWTARFCLKLPPALALISVVVVELYVCPLWSGELGTQSSYSQASPESV